MSQNSDEGSALYAEKLKDPRWIEFRDNVRELRGYKCQWCNAKFQKGYGNLHVHHMTYAPGAEPWEHDIGDVVLICDRCHEDCHTKAKAVVERLDLLPESVAQVVVATMHSNTIEFLFQSVTRESTTHFLWSLWNGDKISFGEYGRYRNHTQDFDKSKWREMLKKHILRHSADSLGNILFFLDRLHGKRKSALEEGAAYFWKLMTEDWKVLMEENQ